jgi:hypothetical protein
MRYFFILLCLLPFSSWANWKADLTLGVDGETMKAEKQVFVDGKETTVTMGNYILKLTLKNTKVPKNIDIDYVVQEKKAQKLILVNKGQDVVENELSKDIFAKGEPNQPNTIITFKSL